MNGFLQQVIERARQLSRRQRIAIAMAVALLIPAWYVAHRFSKLVDEKLIQGPFANTSNFYAAPRVIARGEALTPVQIATELRQSGYTDAADNAIGFYKTSEGAIEIQPGPDSYFKREPALIKFNGGKVDTITTLQNNVSVPEYMLEPQLIANLSGESREKRRLVTFDSIPKVLVNALLSAEDKHFFSHWGFDPLRVLKAFYVNLRSGKRSQGGSTLTMQLARTLWLEPDKNWKRKITESLITLTLEAKLTKEQIFEHYCNGIYLGQHETFSIHGFGQAARVYFNKDMEQLTLPEAAMLAGIVQRPSYFQPHRHPERALARRNVILGLMLSNGFITQAEHDASVKSPLGLKPGSADWGESPYFLALASQELEARLGDKMSDDAAYRIYTTLDQGLQRAAVESVTKGMDEVDKTLKGRYGKAKFAKMTPPQAALIALDPRTGEIKAAVGGRNYASSQLNHLLSKRQPGSIFKPLVYAAALNVRVKGRPEPINPSSTIMDEPKLFRFKREEYEPSNYRDHYMGEVTLRTALAMSLNVAAVSLAEEIGYGRVVELARKAGLNQDILATPAVALGSYVATPVEMAGAYTMFANAGIYTKPRFINTVRSAAGGPAVVKDEPDQHRAMDTRVSYLMLDMLQEVVNSGTGYGARARGLNAPAAGKTGTSRDGWFAGFLSDLLCVVWVGFDDYSELNLEGAQSALPIWTEFMKKAAAQSKYYARPFDNAPSGVISIAIDPDSGMPAGPNCPTRRYSQFVSGSEPRGTCPLHSGASASTGNVVHDPGPAVSVLKTGAAGAAQ